MFFMGTYTPKLDDKGRLFLPAKFRDQLTEGLVVTRGQERCLTVWPMADFVELTRRAQEAPVTVKAARDYTRFLFAGASEELPDKQGRVTITPMLREYAALDRDVVVIGVMNRIEIWDPAAWTTYSEEQEQKFSELSDEEVLLNLQRQATDRASQISVGFSFQFGSIFNNVVNQRFSGGGERF